MYYPIQAVVARVSWSNERQRRPSVVADDPSGYMTGEAGNAIKTVWGADIEQLSVEQGPFELGAAWSTEAGHRAPVRYVIHTAAMFGENASSAELVGSATASALFESERLRLISVAFTALGTGAARLPVVTCGEAMAAAVRRYLGVPSRVRTIEQLVFVLWGSEALREFSRGFRSGVDGDGESTGGDSAGASD